MTATSHLKLGVFAIAAAVAAIVIVLGLGLRRSPAVTYHTYFDESVQGLEVGALVKFRGVEIGRVAAIELGPDRRHVEVELAIERERAERLGLPGAPPGVRARLALLGITGLKIVDLDVVDPAREPPPPALSFTPEQPYIPSQPSLLTGLQRDVARTTDRVPALIEAAISTLERLEAVLEAVQTERVLPRLAAVTEAATQAVARLESALATFERAGRRVDEILEQLDGEDGLVASARRATDAFGDAGRSTRASAAELDRTVRDLGEAARTVRRFFAELERQPDMLLKGRRRSR